MCTFPFLTVALVSPAAVGEPSVQFQHARSLYYRGIDGDERAYRSAAEMFSRLYDTDKKAPIVEVYYGSLRLLEASRTWALWKKNGLSREGIELMDRAVSAEPQNLEIRFVRAATTYHLPGFFHRKQQSQEDFAFLALRAAEAVRKGTFEPRLAAASLYFHGESLEKSGQKTMAEENWRSALAIAPDSPAARSAREKLKELNHQ